MSRGVPSARRARPLDPDRARCAAALLEPLAGRYPLVELFVQEAEWWHLKGSGAELPSMAHVVGLQLSVIGEVTATLSHTTDLSIAGLRAAVERAGAEASPAPPTPWPISPATRSTSELEAWQRALRRLEARARQALGDTVRVTAGLELRFEHRTSTSAPGEGACWTDSAKIVTLTAQRGDLRLQMSEAAEGIDGDLGGLLHRVERRLRLGEPRALGCPRKMPVVLAPGACAALVHELVGHPLEADNVIGEASPFSELAFGDRVASEELSVVDEPLGGAGVDDQGVMMEPVVLVDRGRISGLLHDRVTALMTDDPPTGNGRRQGYRWLAEPRMRRTAVRPGLHDPEALVSDINEGLYIEEIRGGWSGRADGLFALDVAFGRRVRRGALREPVRSARLRGRISEVLLAIEGVGDDVERAAAPYLCGKGSFVDCELSGPTLRLAPVEVIG